MIADEKCRVRFLTDNEEHRITDAPISLPTTLGRPGLSDVINHLLDKSEDPIQFDFMINDHLVRLPLQKFLAVHHISTEDIIIVKYFPAAQMDEPDKSTETPAWIGDIDTSLSGLVIAGLYDGSVRVCDNDLNEVSTISAHADPIRSVVCWSSSSSKGKKSSSQQFLATASKDQTVKCWDVSNPSAATCLATLSGHISSVEALAVWRPVSQPTDTVVLSGDWAGTVFGWNLSKLSEGGAASEDASQDKKKRKKNDASSAGAGETSLKPLFTIKGHSQAVSGMSLSRADGGKNNVLFTCSWDHAIKEWDLERQDCVNTFASSRVATSVDCSSSTSSSMLLASSHPDGKVRCWDARQAKEASAARIALGKTTNWISQVKWQPDSALCFAATDYNGHVSLWDIRSNVPVGSHEVHSGKALSLSWLDSSSSSSSAMDTGAAPQYTVVSGGSDCALKTTTIKTSA